VADRVKSFKVPDESPTFVAYLVAPAPARRAAAAPAERTDPEAAPEEGVSRKREKKKDPGTDLIIHDLAAGTDATIAEVSDYIVTKDGNWVVLRRLVENAGEGRAFARKIADGTTRTLLTGNGNYKSFTADAKLVHLAFLSDRDDYTSAAPVYKLYYVSDTSGGVTDVPLPAGPPWSSARTAASSSRKTARTCISAPRRRLASSQWTRRSR